MKALFCMGLLAAVISLAGTAIADERSHPSTLESQVGSNVEGVPVKLKRSCWPARNVGIAESAKDYYASCGDDDIAGNGDK
ncbi:hypothetical protein GGQ64_001393 [Rhizobium azooxidifex]|uniref:Uncharacterized protein n=1 Tax=Mycoplana azooxidifex TaxID=1636188 RepID=A0A7W6GJS4_9HYPH|nr:hypothetical protein [Mycoplana azooxidifex]MBB3976204.1 hypothetical protein [Mycoplana azooxidifex]